MSECGVYSILLQTEVERAWSLVYARTQKNAVVLALDHLKRDFFNVEVGYTMIPWLDVTEGVRTLHIGDSLTANLTYINHEEQYSNNILSMNPPFSASQSGDQTASLWLGTCLHHVQPSLNGGSNYYIASSNTLARNNFLGQILYKHDLDTIDIGAGTTTTSTSTTATATSSTASTTTTTSSSSPSPSLSARRLSTAQIESHGVTIKAELVTLYLDRGSKCILQETI